jgi:hypothetical protein
MDISTGVSRRVLVRGDAASVGSGIWRPIGRSGETKLRTPSMRNLVDTASTAQSLDGERLMGCLHYPARRIFPDLFG